MWLQFLVIEMTQDILLDKGATSNRSLSGRKVFFKIIDYYLLLYFLIN